MRRKTPPITLKLANLSNLLTMVIQRRQALGRRHIFRRVSVISQMMSFWHKQMSCVGSWRLPVHHSLKLCEQAFTPEVHFIFYCSFVCKATRKAEAPLPNETLPSHSRQPVSVARVIAPVHITLSLCPASMSSFT